jgi:serine/threonine protein kinase/Tfp pilus assembly protein PilF
MPLTAGDRLGPYEILALIGAGGMGKVYRARDTRLDRDVAIKILPDHLAGDPQSLARFERETKAVAALSHSNIVALHDVGRDEGVSYAVTEFLEGEDLRNRLRRGPLPWRKAVQIGIAIAEGLSAAHSKGIIHRDLKPENIFLTAGDGVKILDFGVARWRVANPSPDETSARTETAPGTVLGTVGYMSPEQVRGRVADAPSDIFSLGCVLYEMIEGKRAFARQTPAQTLAAILEDNPPPVTQSEKQIPPEMDRVIARCLEKNPRERIQSARELSFALNELLSGAVASLPLHSRLGLRRITLIGAAFMALFAAAVVYKFNFPAKPVDFLAVLPFVNAGGSADMEYLSEGITESLINSLSQVPNLAVMSRNSVFRYKAREADAQAAGRSLKVQAVVTGRVVQRGDSLLVSAELIDVRNGRILWGERYNRGLGDILGVQEEISSEISSKLRLRLSGEDQKRLTKRYTQNSEAYQLYLKGRYHWNKRTPDGFRKGIDFFQEAIEADPNYAPAYAGLADSYSIMANYGHGLTPPKEAWAKAKRAAEKARQIDDTFAAAHGALATGAYLYDWDWATADKEFKRALELDPNSSLAYHWYAHYLMTMGRAPEALQAGRRALELDPLDLPINAHQGWHYLCVGQYDKAIESLKKTVEMEPGFPTAHRYLGLVYEQNGRLPDAIAEFEKTVHLIGGSTSMLALLGHAHAAAIQKIQAQNILEQLSALAKEKYVSPYLVGAIYAGLGQKDDAFSYLDRAYEERDSWMTHLKLDRRLDGLRADRRFTELLQRMNLSR